MRALVVCLVIPWCLFPATTIDPAKELATAGSPNTMTPTPVIVCSSHAAWQAKEEKHGVWQAKKKEI